MSSEHGELEGHGSRMERMEAKVESTGDERDRTAVTRMVEVNDKPFLCGYVNEANGRWQTTIGWSPLLDDVGLEYHHVISQTNDRTQQSELITKYYHRGG